MMLFTVSSASSVWEVRIQKLIDAILEWEIERSVCITEKELDQARYLALAVPGTCCTSLASVYTQVEEFHQQLHTTSGTVGVEECMKQGLLQALSTAYGDVFHANRQYMDQCLVPTDTLHETRIQQVNLPMEHLLQCTRYHVTHRINSVAQPKQLPCVCGHVVVQDKGVPVAMNGPISPASQLSIAATTEAGEDEDVHERDLEIDALSLCSSPAHSVTDAPETLATKSEAKLLAKVQPPAASILCTHAMEQCMTARSAHGCLFLHTLFPYTRGFADLHSEQELDLSNEFTNLFQPTLTLFRRSILQAASADTNVQLPVNTRKAHRRLLNYTNIFKWIVCVQVPCRQSTQANLQLRACFKQHRIDYHMPPANRASRQWTKYMNVFLFVRREQEFQTLVQAVNQLTFV